MRRGSAELAECCPGALGTLHVKNVVFEACYFLVKPMQNWR